MPGLEISQSVIYVISTTTLRTLFSDNEGVRFK